MLGCASHDPVARSFTTVGAEKVGVPLDQANDLFTSYDVDASGLLELPEVHLLLQVRWHMHSVPRLEHSNTKPHAGYFPVTKTLQLRALLMLCIHVGSNGATSGPPQRNGGAGEIFLSLLKVSCICPQFPWMVTVVCRYNTPFVRWMPMTTAR
jgi:hypothetical protein